MTHPHNRSSASVLPAARYAVVMPDYSVSETRDRLGRDDVVVIDVREAHELAANHVPGMVHIPMSELQDRIDELPTEVELVIFCRSGNRSGQVADYLNSLGDWGEVANCEGGILAWHAEGLPYEGDVPS